MLSCCLTAFLAAEKAVRQQLVTRIALVVGAAVDYVSCPAMPHCGLARSLPSAGPQVALALPHNCHPRCAECAELVLVVRHFTGVQTNQVAGRCGDRVRDTFILLTSRYVCSTQLPCLTCRLNVRFEALGPCSWTW
jgi:hypothetical protein